jgi:hypothetical protein
MVCTAVASPFPNLKLIGDQGEDDISTLRTQLDTVP